MTHEEAVALLAPARIPPGGRWADLGAGRGRFAWALAELLGPEGIVYALDKDARALEGLRNSATLEPAAQVIPQRADFTKPLELSHLDGILLVNSLHFVRNPRRVLPQVMSRVRAGGLLVVIEYERRNANPWVPFPVPFDRLEWLTKKSGLSAPERVATRPSLYHREMYVAVVRREAGA